MKTENKVFSRLFTEDKTELKTQKIELGLIDDLDKKLNSFIQKNKEIGKTIDQVAKIKSNFKSEFKGLSKENDKLISGYKELFKKASEIGADNLASRAFKAQNEVTKNFGQGWDNDTLRFMQK